MQIADKPPVYVVVLNWNNYEDTKICIESLQKATYPDLQVIVVDNGSVDGSGKQLQDEFPNLSFIFNNENLGFARGCNVGIRAALKKPDCAYVLLLNNDAVVSSQFLEKAIDTAEADKRIGLIGGKILTSPESKQIAYAGGHVDYLRAGSISRGSLMVDKGQYDTPQETGFILGALMLIKREVLERCGLLPEEYFFGIEDLDYSKNVKRAGYKLYYVPEFVAYHRGAGSHSDFDPKLIYVGYRSRLIFQEKYLPKAVFPIWKQLFILYAKYIERYRAIRTWRKIAEKREPDKLKMISAEDMDFAFRRAIEDHKKVTLSEETLAHFLEALRKRKSHP